MMKYITLLFLITLINRGFSTSPRDYYRVPDPIIEVYSPKGFSVRIPHSDGVTLFAFHGKINEEMEGLEAGQFSEDILKKKGDFWIFKDQTTKLDINDIIYFWLFVIKNGLGYRYDGGMYKVKELYPRDVCENATSTRPTTTSMISEATTMQNTETTTKFPDARPKPSLDISAEICERTILNITDSLLRLLAEVNSLKDTNEILREISEKHPASARTLKVEGRIPVNEDALSTVKGIIKQKLALSIEIVDAKRNKDGSITFETTNLDDKIQIIKTAKEKLKYSRIQVIY